MLPGRAAPRSRLALRPRGRRDDGRVGQDLDDFAASLRRRAAFFLVTGATLLPLPAAAHAIIVSSDPAADAVVRPPSLPVMLRFNSRIDPERSRVVGTARSGAGTTVSRQVLCDA